MISHQPTNSLTNYNCNTALYTDTVWEHHFHKNLELIYVIRGVVKCTVNNSDYILEEGCFGLCLPCDIHRYEPSENTLYWVVVFSEDFVRSFSKSIAGRRGDGFAFRADETVRKYILDRLISNESPSLFTLKSCLYAACEEYLKSVSLVDKKEKELKTVTRISDYILENYTKEISLKEISRELGYDYNYMSRYFKKSFKTSFNDFVSSYRLEHSIKLLDETNKSIVAIAYESGFQSVRSFNEVFRKNMNMSPSEYRAGKRRATAAGEY